MRTDSNKNDAKDDAKNDAKSDGKSGAKADVKHVVDVLEHVAMLRGVPPALRREIAQIALSKSLVAGDVLIRQGEPGVRMYFLVAGELAITLGDPSAEPIAIIRPGDTVGELGVLEGGTASANVVAKSACELMSLDEEGFWSLTHKSHAFAINLIVKLAERLRANN